MKMSSNKFSAKKIVKSIHVVIIASTPVLVATSFNLRQTQIFDVCGQYNLILVLILVDII